MQTVALARNAMATRFEIVLHGHDPARLRAAGEEALAEIERLEGQLSLFRPASQIARVNAAAAREPVRITPPIFQLLRLAQNLWRETGGAFDIAIAPLMRCWGFTGGPGRMPAEADVAQARRIAGMEHVQLDETNCSVRFDAEGVTLDLGAIGKGYAVDRAAETLREAGVASALVHGGTSTVYGIGHPPDAEAWKVAIDGPPSPAADEARPLATVALRDSALSVSAVWGKSFESGGKKYGHIIDPRTGWPANHASLAAVGLPSATETDALSTALLVLGVAGHAQIVALRPEMASLALEPDGAAWKCVSQGLDFIEIPRVRL